MLKDKINEDLKAAMKSGDKLRLETIRSLRAVILEFEKSGIGKEMTADDEIKLLATAVKKRKDAIQQYTDAGRTELADKESQELAIIQEYMPKQLTTEEIEAEIKSIAAEIGATTKADFGKLMPAVVKALKGKADGGIIRPLVEKYLS